MVRCIAAIALAGFVGLWMCLGVGLCFSKKDLPPCHTKTESNLCECHFSHLKLFLPKEAEFPKHLLIGILFLVFPIGLRNPVAYFLPLPSAKSSYQRDPAYHFLHYTKLLN